MSRFHSYLNTAATILSEYKGETPLANWLKDFFSKDKKFGSGDRKWIAHLCYCFYRTGHAFEKDDMQDKILKGLFLCSHSSNLLLDAIWPECNMRVDHSFYEKLKWLNESHAPESIFPWQPELSNGIDAEEFSLSHLHQPHLYLRIRPGRHSTVTDKLRDHGIVFHQITEDCIQLPNGTKIEKVISIDEDVVVQDYNSQRIGELIGKAVLQMNRPVKVWDCCAASGGKSILAKDILGNVELTVSDIRPSILSNLKKRFSRAGIRNYKSLTLDLRNTVPNLEKDYFDLIIADLPCTGSGTWSRTPEELYFFDPVKIGKFSSLQRIIINNVLPHLKKGGKLVYTSCSVFAEENENNVRKIDNEARLNISTQEIFTGYNIKADTLFGALLGS